MIPSYSQIINQYFRHFRYTIVSIFQNVQEHQIIYKYFNTQTLFIIDMIDWEGLLKFSLKYSDGTKKSEFKEMTTEDKKWLEQAMHEYCNSQIKRIGEILTILENFIQLQAQTVQANLEQLQELLDSLDRGATLYKLGGHIILLKIIFYSKDQNSKEIALQIYSSINQNDAHVQNESINTGALEMIDLLKKETNSRNKENLFAAVSATLRGENLQAKRIFIRLEGLQLMAELTKDATPKLLNKINTLWRDLILYDDHLHFTFNDLTAFSNTSNIKAEKQDKYDLSYDVNQQYKQKNELPENAKFKGCVKKFMQSRKQLFEGYLKWLKQQIQRQSE